MKKIFSNVFLSVSIIILFVSIFQSGCTSGKQIANATKEEIIQSINNNRWIFTANFATTQTGRSRNLTDSYEVKYTKDTLIVSLPYYGEAYAGADVLSNQNPLDFKSTDLTFNKIQKKADEWLVTIKPKDNREVQSFSFNFFDNGTAQLAVILTNRSSINFKGIISPAK